MSACLDLKRLARGLLLLLLLVAVSVGVLLSGCSSDSSTGVTGAIPGDPDSPEYGSVNGVLGGEAFNLTGLHWHSLLEGEIPGAVSARARTATPAHDTVLSDTVTVDSATGWIVLSAVVANHHDTAEILDSVRFYLDGVPTIPSDDRPVDSMTSVDVYIRGHLRANDSSEFVGQLEHASRINVEVLERDLGLGTVTYELNLTSNDTLQGTAWDSVWGVCDVHVTAQRVISDLIEVEEADTSHHPIRETNAGVWQAMAAHEGCPLAGSVLLEMDVDLHCSGGEAEVAVDAEWTVEAKFVGGDQVRITFTSEGFYWTKTIPCSELTEL